MKHVLFVLLALMMSVSAVAAEQRTVHTVQNGESLESIAFCYNLTTEALLKANPAAKDNFYVGMLLIIPDTTKSTPSVNSTSSAAPVLEKKVATESAPSVSRTETMVSQSTEYSAKPRTTKSKPVKVKKKDDDDTYSTDKFRFDSEGDRVFHHMFAMAQYQMTNFEYAKESSWYGVGMAVTSFSHWGALHVGGNINVSLNAGIIEDFSLAVDLGPSVRYDINRSVFVNVPINVMCICNFGGEKDFETSWGLKVSPALHYFFNDRFGLYAGPQICFGFGAGSSVVFGMVAGITFQF